jgi:very-short-patch-repair endonuclease
MRHCATKAERILWHALRGKQLDGFKFRRQAPIGPFIADFFCPEARLITEVDGATHDDPKRDAARDAWMQAQDLRVLRFWGEEVTVNLDGVLRAILMALREPLPPPPSCKGRGRRKPSL